MEQLTEGTSNFEPLSPKAFGSDMQKVVMPIFAEDGENIVSIGTGFVVGGNQLLMTAAHVVKDAIGRGRRVLGPDGKWIDASGLYALYVSSEKHDARVEHYLGGLLPIDHVWCNDLLDIGLCWLRLPIINGKPIRILRMRLSPGLPKLGDSITAFGYHGLSEPLQTDNDGKRVLPYESKGSFSTGKIVDIHEMHRDSAMLSFPCFRTTARFDAGMSGGPVVNSKGNVCGVVCAGSGCSGDGTYSSYASLLWLAMGCTINIAPSEDAPIESRTLMELVPSGFVMTDGTETQVSVKRAPSGEIEVRLRRE
jgi:hypothetical protein